MPRARLSARLSRLGWAIEKALAETGDDYEQDSQD